VNTKDVLFDLRTKNGLSQDELAEKVFVTRQAVSRWENGETVLGVIAEPELLRGMKEISSFGGWRKYLADADFSQKYF